MFQNPVMLGVAVVVVLFALLSWVVSRIRRAGPNEAMIIYGRGRIRVVTGGTAVVFPWVEEAKSLSLEIMTLDVTTPEVYTLHGVPIIVDGVAQTKVEGTEEAIKTASEQFLGKTQAQVMNIALQTVEGHLRAILGTMSVEEVYSNRDAFAARVQDVAASDMANMGLKIVSFTIRDIRDQHGYLEALGKPRTAQVKRDAVIGEAEAQRDSTIKSASARQEGETARFQAEIKIAEAQRDLEMRKAEFAAQVNEKKAQADLAYDLQKFKTNQSVAKEEVQVEVVRKDMEIQVQDKEIERRTRELEAQVKRPADASRYQVEVGAEAERRRIELVAEGEAKAKQAIGVGEAEANRARGLAEADIRKAQGLAQAEVIRQQGISEAEAMTKKASAWQQYNQAAILEKVLAVLPEVAGAIAQPLSRTERIVMVNTGGAGDGIGASRITHEVATILSQLPPVVEALSGVDLQELLSRVPRIGSSAPAPAPEAPAPGAPEAPTHPAA